MRFLYFILFVFFLNYACKQKNNPLTFNIKQSSTKHICLVPYQGFDSTLTFFIKTEIENYFNRKVILFSPNKLKSDYINVEKGLRYSADSIIKNLSYSKSDSILCYVGLTNQDIFTTIKDKDGNIELPIEKYKIWGIFGLGYCPGNACVVSSKRLQTNDVEKFKHRMRTVVIHEIGHNMGLPHCNTKNCIMSDANEKISTVDESNSEMCPQCALKINLVK